MLSQLGRVGALGIQRVGIRDAPRHPPVPRTVPMKKFCYMDIPLFIHFPMIGHLHLLILSIIFNTLTRDEHFGV